MTTSAIAVEDMSSEAGPGGSGRWRGGVGFLSRWHVLDAAMACFAAEGYEGVTIRAIAGRLGCSVGSIYRYFEDKQALLRACGAEAMRPAVEAAEDMRAPLAAAVEAYAVAAERQAELYRLMMWLGDAEAARPTVVDRVLAGWAAKLDDAAAAERLWSELHGRLCLGRGIGAAAEVFADAGRPQSPRDAADASPLPDDEAPASASARSVEEDVTLL